MTDFLWYKDSFLSKLYTLPDPNQDFWKEKYISDLPPLFAEKVRNSLRKEGEWNINY
jgi:predicted transcriptional regulator